MKEGIFLSKQDQFRYRQIAEFNSGKLSCFETARLLKLSERSVTRLGARVAKNGFLGVRHKNRDRTPVNKLDSALKKRILKLVSERYYDFNMLHCLEVLKSRHKIVIARETFRRWCHEKQLVKRKKRRRSKPRHYRSRMPAEGYLLQMDGSNRISIGGDIYHLRHPKNLSLSRKRVEIRHYEAKPMGIFFEETELKYKKYLSTEIQTRHFRWVIKETKSLGIDTQK